MKLCFKLSILHSKVFVTCPQGGGAPELKPFVTNMTAYLIVTLEIIVYTENNVICYMNWKGKLKWEKNPRLLGFPYRYFIYAYLLGVLLYEKHFL